MRKRFLSMILAMAILAGTCGIALAADEMGGATRKGLKSYGKITYQNGGDAVVVDSADFYMLADRLDLFKRGVADQLTAINTYFTTEDGISLKTEQDIRVAHTKPSGENAVDPLEVDFDTLLEGIAASQSVPADVSATKEDNLSAGTAAWVDGHLIIGTGGDNQRHYQNGYEEGAAAGSGRGYSSGDVVNNGNYTTTYTVPEDMKDVIVYYYGPDNASISFTPAAQYQVLMRVGHQIDGDHTGYRVCNFLYLPDLKAGTVINYNGFVTHLWYK